MDDPYSTRLMHQHPRWPSTWWRALITALVLYVAAVWTLALTRNAKLFPAVVMLGSFMVPVVFVVFLYNHRHLSRINLETIAEAFFYGGLLGVLAASVLEPVFVGRLNAVSAFRVGVIEEAVKILGVLVVASGRRHDSMLDGIILGAAAGMGFAALESAGYAFTAFVTSRGSLSMVVAVTLLRGVLAPLGHGTWTAILGGALFRESRNGRYHITPIVVGAYLLVVLLHGLWDAIPGVMAARLVTPLAILLGEGLVGAIGLLILGGMWAEAVLRQRPPYLVRRSQLDEWDEPPARAA